jgi:hypothetical protein
VCPFRRDQLLHLLGSLFIGADDLQRSALEAVDIPLAPAIPGVGIGLHELDVLALPLVMRQAIISCGGAAVPSLLLLIGSGTLLLRLVVRGRLSCILRTHGIDSEVQVQVWSVYVERQASTIHVAADSGCIHLCQTCAAGPAPFRCSKDSSGLSHWALTSTASPLSCVRR